MLRVSLGEHVQFNIVGVTAQRLEVINQVVDFILGQSQAHAQVGFGQRLTALAKYINAGQRRRLGMLE